jgi:hypothetical protein
VISASIDKAAPAVHKSEAAIRMICRAVIRRVRDEYPESSGYELFLRFWAAYPFGSDDDVMQQIFHEEVLRAVGRLEAWDAGDPVVGQDVCVYAASAFLQ